ncbi:WD40 repeat domain-containing protein [Cryptosporangium phraense]|uniref:WD40 repeat domain-containing protein n=1 Tax=Cryptosporangium phraense TaxID=2593070 RepID=UPI0014785846|nr:WD40 repeat domain-containing protein [Cryptosporangium phraense]
MSGLAFCETPDQHTRLVASEYSGAVRTWDLGVRGRQPARNLKRFPTRPSAAPLSTIAVLGEPGLPPLIVAGGREGTVEYEFRPDRGVFAAITGRGEPSVTRTLGSLETGQELAEFAMAPSAAGGGWWIAIGDPAGRVWASSSSARDGRRTLSPDHRNLPTTGGIRCLAWVRSGGSFGVSSDGEPLLAIADREGHVHLWDTGTGDRITTLDGDHLGVRTMIEVPTADGLLVTTGFGLRVWNGERCLDELTGHTDFVRSVAALALPDGTTLLASGSQDGTVRIWDPERLTCLGLVPVGDKVHSVALVAVAGGRTLLACGTGDPPGTLQLWELAVAGDSAGPSEPDGSVIVGRHRGPVRSVAFEERDGAPSAVLSGGDDGIVARWRTDHRAEGEVIARHDGPVRAVLSRLGDFDAVVSGGDDGMLAGTRTGSIGAVRPFSAQYDAPITALATWPSFGHDGGLLAIAAGSVFVEDVRDIPWLGPSAIASDIGGRPAIRIEPFGIEVRGKTSPFRALAFGEAGPRLFLLGEEEYDGPPRRPWGLPTPAPGVHDGFVDSLGDAVNALAFAETPAGPIVASGTETGEVVLRDVTDSRMIGRLVTGRDAVHALAWLPAAAGRWPVLAVACGDGGRVLIWDPGTDRVRREFPQPAVVRSLAARAVPGTDSVQLALGADDGTVRTLVIPAAEPSRPAPEPSAGDLTITDWPIPLEGMDGSRGATTGRCIAAAVLADGRRVVARSLTDGVHVWDCHTGRLLRTLRASSATQIAWVRPVGSDPQLVVNFLDEPAQIWNPVTGVVVQRLPNPGNTTLAVDAVETTSGARYLALGFSSGTVELIDGTGRTTLEHPTEGPVADVRYSDGPPARLAVAHRDGSVAVWDAGQSPARFRVFDSEESDPLNGMSAVAWSSERGTAQRLATAADGGVKIWDAETGALLRTLPVVGAALSVVWLPFPDGTEVVACGGGAPADGSNGTIRIFDPASGALLAELLEQMYQVWSLDAVPLADGRVLLAAGDSLRTPLRLYAVTLRHRSAPAPADPVTPLEAACADQLVALGAGGLWPPLGWLVPVVDALGPDPSSEHAGLAADPGLSPARDLGWPVRARVGLAALLLAALPSESRWVAPPDVSAADALTALRAALRSGAAPPVIDRLPHERLRDAARRLDRRLWALLRVLGAEAVAADPLLPLRLRDRAATAPDFAAALVGLAASFTDADVAERTGATTVAGHAGAGGIGRRGRLTGLLPSQLALPPDVLDLRLVRGELLYRQFEGEPEPRPEPVTLVLDTGPATFGPVETALRLVAHAVIVASWRAGLPAAIVTTDRPEAVTAIRSPADLVAVWTRRGLTSDTLARAVAAAGTTGRVVAVLTDHHRAAEHPLVGAPRLRVVTSHVPGDEPDVGPASGFHAHVPPSPDRTAVQYAVRALLRPATRATPAGNAPIS